jgi:hypothetical protein
MTNFEGNTLKLYNKKFMKKINDQDFILLLCNLNGSKNVIFWVVPDGRTHGAALWWP